MTNNLHDTKKARATSSKGGNKSHDKVAKNSP